MLKIVFSSLFVKLLELKKSVRLTIMFYMVFYLNKKKLAIHYKLAAHTNNRNKLILECKAFLMFSQRDWYKKNQLLNIILVPILTPTTFY